MKNLLTIFYMFSELVVRAVQTPHLPFFSPCTFPSPLYEPLQFRLYCNLMPHLPFICDLHQQLSDSGSTVILEAFEKLRPVLVRNDSSLSLGILVVRQLAPPTSSSVVYSNKHEYGCLFEDECIHMNAEKIQQFVISARTFIKIYTSALYNRWFLEDTTYSQPNILAVIILDGLVNDVRKLPYVKIYTDNLRLLSSMFNIQSECVNNILQGWPLHMVIADLIKQLGHSLREFCLLDGDIRLHIVPSWAIYIFILCVILLFLAIFMEWYIVRRKIRYKRTVTGIQLHASKRFSGWEEKTEKSVHRPANLLTTPGRWNRTTPSLDGYRFEACISDHQDSSRRHDFFASRHVRL